jgi:hypothetical protein
VLQQRLLYPSLFRLCQQGHQFQHILNQQELLKLKLDLLCFQFTSKDFAVLLDPHYLSLGFVTETTNC